MSRRSETEFDTSSIASFTTHQSSTSYQSPAYASSSRLTVPGPVPYPRPRTLSSISFSSSPSPRLEQRSTSPSTSTSHARLHPPGVDDATIARRGARRKRRAEREKRSTLRGEMYGSPLREAVRWCANNERKETFWMVCAIVSFLTRVTLSVLLADGEQSAPDICSCDSVSGTSADMSVDDVTQTRRAIAWLASQSSFIHSLTRLSDRHVWLLDSAFKTLGSSGLSTVLWLYATRRWTHTEATTSGRSWRTEVRPAASRCVLPSRRPQRC